MTNTITALIIDTAETDQHGIRTIADDDTTLRHLVGGDLQAVYGYRRPDHTLAQSPRITLFCNENGKLHRLDVNRIATTLWWHYNPPAVRQDFLVGPVVITGPADEHGQTTSLPHDIAEVYNAVLASYTLAADHQPTHHDTEETNDHHRLPPRGSHPQPRTPRAGTDALAQPSQPAPRPCGAGSLGRLHAPRPPGAVAASLRDPTSPRREPPRDPNLRRVNTFRSGWGCAPWRALQAAWRRPRP